MVLSPAQPSIQRAEDCQYWDVSASFDVTYKVIRANGVLLSSNPLLLQLGVPEKNYREDRARRLVFVESEVFRFYSGAINRFFCGEGSRIVVLSATEKTKNLRLVERTVEQMAQFGINRRSEPVIAIGGGCLMDTIGFAASIYRRHVPYVRVPTTLLGIVDAGIGIKTGVNFGLHKNRIGSYCAPIAAVLDTTFLGDASENGNKARLYRRLWLPGASDCPETGALSDLQQHIVGNLTCRYSRRKPACCDLAGIPPSDDSAKGWAAREGYLSGTHSYQRHVSQWHVSAQAQAP